MACEDTHYDGLGPTVGAFLKEKVTNMINWITKEVGKENLPPDVAEFVAARTYVELTLFAEVLNANHSLIVHRDWAGIVRQMKLESVPDVFITALQTVRSHEHMHDKFWRYLEMFSRAV
jgi:hypothetical protein